MSHALRICCNAGCSHVHLLPAHGASAAAGLILPLGQTTTKGGWAILAGMVLLPVSLLLIAPIVMWKVTGESPGLGKPTGGPKQE